MKINNKLPVDDDLSDTLCVRETNLTPDNRPEDIADDECVVELNTEDQVHEALEKFQHLSGCVVPFDTSIHDDKESLAVSQFTSKGCGCTLCNGKPCSSQFTTEYITTYRNACLDLTHNELDLFLMGQLAAFGNSGQVVIESRHHEKEREKAYTTIYHRGRRVCMTMFRVLHAVGKKRIFNLSRSLKHDGVRPRVNGNASKLPKHTLTFQSVETVVKFLLSYTEQHGLLLPGRVPGYSRSDIKLLPSSASKRTIWKTYQAATEGCKDVQCVAYSTFNKLWKSLLPSVIIMKPMSDLCWQCQKQSSAILKAANSALSEKSVAIASAQEHLDIVTLERSYYKTLCDTCRVEVKQHFTVDGQFQAPPLFSRIPPNSNDIQVHYSFDYAQQVHFPADPLQPGPIYFLVPRKCSIFGVHCEALPRQVNFLTDEAGACGKGANTVVSQLHYFLENHGLGEKRVFLHADNCTGQNKNACMMQYLAWRAMTKRLTLSFLVVGHTKFAPDWCFGLFKQSYRRTRVGCLGSIAEVVNKSAECNFAQLCSTEDAGVIVPTYDWTTFFAPHLKKISGIKKYYHFRFESSEPGVVYVKERINSPNEEKISLLKESPSKEKWSPEVNVLPEIIEPKGLSVERQWYLYEHIREFCPDEDKDVTCPKPSVPKPNSRAGTPDPSSVLVRPPPPTSTLPSTSGPPAKKQRICGICKKGGHNSRTCPNKEE